MGQGGYGPSVVKYRRVKLYEDIWRNSRNGKDSDAYTTEGGTIADQIKIGPTLYQVDLVFMILVEFGARPYLEA